MVARRIAIFSLVVFAFALAAPSPTLACSGGGPPWSERLPGLIQYNDVVVIGGFAKLDDADINGIFHARMYLNGSGPGYLLVSATDVRYIENSRYVHRFYRTCGGIGTIYREQSATQVFFLRRLGDGTYEINLAASFRDADSTFSVWERAEETGSVEIRLTLEELVAQITAEAGHEPLEPNPPAGYPRLAPVLITTQNDQYFLLPVDTKELVPVAEEDLVDLQRGPSACSAPPCAVYSPNGLDKVYLYAEEGDAQPLHDDIRPTIETRAIGQQIVFSPTSDTYALWHDEQIQIYILWYPDWGYPPDRLAENFNAEVVNTTPAGNSLDYPVAWSPDGRILAFSTDEGLWLWDALTSDYPPQLLIPANSDVPTARYFSPKGRYLAITDGNRRYNLDLMTRREMPDGYISPDDRTLLVFDTATTVPTTLEVMRLAPGIRRTEYYPEVQYRKVQWMDTANFVAAISGFGYTEWVPIPPYKDAAGEWVYEALPEHVDEAFRDVAQYHASGLTNSIYEAIVPYAVRTPFIDDFTYEDGPGLIEINVGGYELWVNGRLFSFDTVLPSPIKDAVWLPSAFYFEHD